MAAAVGWGKGGGGQEGNGARMGRSRWIAVALVTLGVVLIPKLSLMALGGADNPLKNAKVGEWIEFTMNTETMGQTIAMKMKQTVVAKDATSVTLRTETTAMGKQMAPQDVKIQLDKPYEPYKGSKETDAVATPMGEGSETITVGGKPYACHWAKVKVVATKPVATEGVVTVWYSKDVPVSGMVRMVNDSTMKVGDQTMKTKMTMDVTGYGK